MFRGVCGERGRERRLLACRHAGRGKSSRSSSWCCRASRSQACPLLPLLLRRLGAVGAAAFSAFSNPWVAKAFLAGLWTALRFLGRTFVPVPIM